MGRPSSASPASRGAPTASTARSTSPPAVLVALVLVLLLSAADRMRLYLDAFGLTQARFHAAA